MADHHPAEVMLAEYLRAGASRPFAWGLCDCTTWACDWIKAVMGVDPAAEFRGRYATERGATRHLVAGRGLVPLAERCMKAAGLRLTVEPSPGDVGAIKTADGPALAIRTMTGWAIKGPRGVTMARDPIVLRAWRVAPCP